MWEIVVIARDKYDEICEKFKQLNYHFQCMKNYFQISDGLIWLLVYRNPSSVRGHRADIIYCDKEPDPQIYEEVVRPCANGGIVRPLDHFTSRLNIKVR